MNEPEVDAPHYTDDEKAALTENLRAVTEVVHGGALSLRPIRFEVLADLHRSLFLEVRSHAGRARCPGFGSEVLRFGPWYSTRRNEVDRELTALFRWIANSVAELEAHREAAEYTESALRVALRAHTEVIRIHPFEDGNGRSSRLLLDWLLVRLELPPVSFDVVREEYIRALEEAFRGDDTLLLDLVIRVQSDALSADAG